MRSAKVGRKYHGASLVSWLALILAFCLWGTSANAAESQQTFTRADYTKWLEQYANATPDFKPGDVLTAKDLERLRPFVIPGYLQFLNFAEFRAPIVAPIPHTPHPAYMQCTEKYQSQVRLKPDGTLENYKCGQPFPNSDLKVNDPTSAIKAAWNYNWKWMYYGIADYAIPWIWVRFDGAPSHSVPTLTAPESNFVSIVPPSGWQLPADLHSYYAGGGTFQRTLLSNYQHMQYSHLATLDGGALPVPGAENIQYKELTGFYSPFDIRSTAFVIYRYNDPFRSDDAWAYLPTLRRVRRISAEVKSDSLLGTDITLDDFYGYNGRVPDMEWKILGWKYIFCVDDPREQSAHVYGPQGITPNENWEIRKMLVLERVPKNSRHPYSSAIMFVDPENYYVPFHVAFDRAGKLWKIFQWQWKWSETIPPPWNKYNTGVDTVVWQAVNCIDVQNQRGTIVNGFGDGFPNVMTNLHWFDKHYDINNLEILHR